MSAPNRPNLHGILQSIRGRQVENLTLEDIRRMKLEIIDRSMEDSSNAKALEVALKAIQSLETMLDRNDASEVDDSLAAKLPEKVLKLVNNGE